MTFGPCWILKFVNGKVVQDKILGERWLKSVCIEVWYVRNVYCNFCLCR